MIRFDPASYNLFIILVVVCVLFGSFVVYQLQRDIAEDSCPVTDQDLLKDFERAYYAGEMDEAEFRRVAETLHGKRKGGIPAAPKTVVKSEPSDSSNRAEPPEDEAVS